MPTIAKRIETCVLDIFKSVKEEALKRKEKSEENYKFTFVIISLDEDLSVIIKKILQNSFEFEVRWINRESSHYTPPLLGKDICVSFSNKNKELSCVWSPKNPYIYAPEKNLAKREKPVVSSGEILGELYRGKRQSLKPLKELS